MALLQSADSPEASHALQRLIEGDFETRWDAAKQIVRLGPSVLPTLLALLSDEIDEAGPVDPLAPETKTQALNESPSRYASHEDSGEEGAGEEEAGEEEADEYDIELRWFIARILGELEHPVAVDALLNLVKASPHPEVAAIAATSLAKAGDLALPALTELLKQPEHRILAVQALSQLGHSTAIPALLSVVNDAEDSVRAVAIEALTAFRDRRVTPILAQALGDTSSAVRLAALRGIGSRGHQLPEIDALVSRIGELLGDLNLDVSCQAAIALGRLNNPVALSHLDKALYHPLMPLALKTQAIRALAWSENEQALHLLKSYLLQLIPPLPQETSVTHSSDSIGETAIEAAPPITIAPGPLNARKKPHLSHSDSLSLEIVRVLGRMDNGPLADQATELLLKVLDQCQAAPGQAAPSQTAPAGNNANTVELKASIALSLGQLGHQQAFKPLLALLSHPSPHLRFHILAALKRLNPEGGRQQLITAQQHETSEALAQGLTFALSEWD